MKRILSLWLTLTLLLTMIPLPVGAAESKAWDGTSLEIPEQADGIYQIDSGAKLAWFAALVNGQLEETEQDVTANAVLTADIDLGNQSWTPIADALLNCPYNGSFDGQNHTISGFYMSGRSYTGLFGSVGPQGSIQNLAIKGSVVTEGFHGSIAADLAGRVKNCQNYVEITASAGNIGGIVGTLSSTDDQIVIDGCTNYGNITETLAGSQKIGGILGGAKGWGYNSIMYVQNCTNYGDVYCVSNSGSGAGYVGGIIGYSVQTRYVYNLCNYGDITAYSCVGGVIGDMEQLVGKVEQMENLCNMGTVTGYGRNVGGIVGYWNTMSEVPMWSFYNAGKVTGIDSAAGLIGYSTMLKIERGYSWGECTSNKLIGNTGGSGTNVYGLDTANSATSSDRLVDKTTLRSDEMLQLLNGDNGTFFVKDYTFMNNGFPVSNDQAKAEQQKTLTQVKKEVTERIQNHVSLEDYRSAEQTQVQEAISAGVEAVEKAATFMEVSNAVWDAMLQLEAIPTDAQLTAAELRAAKDSAIEQLNATDLTPYRDTEKGKVESIISTASTRIKESDTIARVNSLLKTAKSQIAAVKTDAQLTLEEAKAAAKETLKTHVDEADYRTSEQEQIRAIIEETEPKIEAANTVENVKSVLEQALARLDALKTDKELSEEALNAYKQEAIAALESYVNVKDYRTAQQKEIAAAIADGSSAIGQADSTQAVDKALETAKAVIDKIQTDEQMTAAEYTTLMPKLTSAKATGYQSIRIRWESFKFADGYYIYRKSGSGNWSQIGSVNSRSTVDYQDKQAKVGVTYSYTVQAYWKVGGETLYSSYDADGICAAADIPAGVSLTSVSATAYNAITVKWSGTTGATGYEVYRSKTENGTYTRLAAVTTTSYVDKSVSCGTTYYYQVRAKRNSSYGSFSKSLSAKTKLGTATLSSVKSTAYNKIVIQWKKVAGATGYEIYRSTKSGSGYKKIAAVAGSKTSYTNTGVNCGVKYYYKVRAKRQSVYGGYSKVLNAKPVLGKPTLKVTAQSKKAKIQWTKVAGASNYELYMATGNGKFKKIKTATVQAGLKKNKTYRFKVRAYRTVNGKKVYGDFSAVKSVKIKK